MICRFKTFGNISYIIDIHGNACGTITILPQTCNCSTQFARFWPSGKSKIKFMKKIKINLVAVSKLNEFGQFIVFRKNIVIGWIKDYLFLPYVRFYNMLNYYYKILKSKIFEVVIYLHTNFCKKLLDWRFTLTSHPKNTTITNYSK